MTPRLLPRILAAEYLGMSDTLFDRLVAGRIPVVALGKTSRGYRYDRLDLDAWADSQPRLQPQEETCADRPASTSEAKSGTARKPSGPPAGSGSFDKALAQARLRRRRAS